MNDAAVRPDTQAIVVDEVLPHAPETIWKTLTSGELVIRWLKMPATGFEAVKGAHFMLQHAGRTMGRFYPMRGVGSHPEPTPRL